MHGTIGAGLAAIHAYENKHRTCTIQQHPWQSVFGAGFEAGAGVAAVDELAAEVERLTTENDTLRVENGRLRLALGPVAEGCGHTRCHAYPWIMDAREALSE